MIWRNSMRLLEADFILHISRELIKVGNGPSQCRFRVLNLLRAGNWRLNARNAGTPVEDSVIGILSSSYPSRWNA